MSELRRMNEDQFRRARKLIRRLCANYDGGNCLPLDDGGPCAQKERRRKTRDRVRRHRG